jgi:hypothetical protein
MISVHPENSTYKGEEGCGALIDQTLPSMGNDPGTADGLLARSLP